MLFRACRNKEFWQGLGSGVWNEVKGLWDGARSVLDAATSAPAIMAKPGAGLAMEMAIAVEVHRVMVGLYDMARNAEFLEILKTLVPEIGVLLTQPVASPDWCKALGLLSGSGAFELLTLLLAPELTPAKLAALAGKLGPRIGKAADDVAELIARARKLVPEKTGCFVAGTLVATASGLVPIETIQVGDMVWARDESTGEVRLCRVEAAYHRESIPIVEVIVGGEVVATTEEHPFWVQDDSWKNAGELQVGDHLITLNGESVVVEDIRRRPLPEDVYNLHIGEFNTYHVGSQMLLVHNKPAETGFKPGSGWYRYGENPPFKRVPNPKHHPRSASPEPKNVDELFKRAIWEEADGPGWVRDEEGLIHRFSAPSNGTTHWNGSGFGDNVVPNQIRKAL